MNMDPQFKEIKKSIYKKAKLIEFHRALEVVKSAFAGKKDKGGNDYVFHLYRVADYFDQGKNLDVIIVALLHDLLEDCSEWSEEKLRKEFSQEVCDAVVCLTKKPNEVYSEYITRVKTNKIATLVKIADLEDNMKITRLPKLEDKDLKRLQKYHQTWVDLMGFVENNFNLKNEKSGN